MKRLYLATLCALMVLPVLQPAAQESTAPTTQPSEPAQQAPAIQAAPEPEPEPEPRVEAQPRAAPQVEPEPEPVRHAEPPAKFAGDCYANQPKLLGGRLCVSSILDPQFGNRYGGLNLLDNKPDTAWVEGARGQGEGEGILIMFDRPTRVQRVRLINGYAKNADIYNKNSRVREIVVTSSRGPLGTSNILDMNDIQGFEVLYEEPVTWIAFTIKSVFPGNRYKDTAISELRLD